MKETQGQSWVIAAVRALRPRIRFLLFSFSLSTTPLPPSLPPSLSLSISPSSSPYPCGTRISTVPRYVRHDDHCTQNSTYRHIPGVPRAFQSFRKSRRLLGRNDTVSRDMQSSSSKRRKDGNSYLFARAIYTRKMTKTRAKIAQNRTTLEQYSLSLYSPRDRNVRDKK